MSYTGEEQSHNSDLIRFEHQRPFPKATFILPANHTPETWSKLELQTPGESSNAPSRPPGGAVECSA